MIRIRNVMILTALLASSATANAQSLSVASLGSLENAYWATVPIVLKYTSQAPEYFPPAPSFPLPRELATLEAAAEQHRAEAATAQPSWFVQAVEQGAALWERLRAQARGKDNCCEAGSARVMPGCVGQPNDVLVRVRETCTSNLMLGAGVNSNSGVVSSISTQSTAAGQPACCGLKPFTQFTAPVQYRVIQVAAPCCCAKACACCESCKASKPAAAARVQPAPPPFMPYPVQAWPAPAPAIMPPAASSLPPVPGIIVSGPALPNWLIPRAPSARPLPRLETPDFEAHCEKITQRGDTVLLEGSVLFLSKKHAKPLRIDAQRIIVNMKDGSYVVEIEGLPTPTTVATPVSRVPEPMLRHPYVVPGARVILLER